MSLVVMMTQKEPASNLNWENGCCDWKPSLFSSAASNYSTHHHSTCLCVFSAYIKLVQKFQCKCHKIITIFPYIYTQHQLSNMWPILSFICSWLTPIKVGSVIAHSCLNKSMCYFSGALPKGSRWQSVKILQWKIYIVTNNTVHSRHLSTSCLCA